MNTRNLRSQEIEDLIPRAENGDKEAMHKLAKYYLVIGEQDKALRYSEMIRQSSGDEGNAGGAGHAEAEGLTGDQGTGQHPDNDLEQSLTEPEEIAPPMGANNDTGPDKRHEDPRSAGKAGSGQEAELSRPCQDGQDNQTALYSPDELALEAPAVAAELIAAAEPSSAAKFSALGGTEEPNPKRPRSTVARLVWLIPIVAIIHFVYYIYFFIGADPQFYEIVDTFTTIYIATLLRTAFLVGIFWWHFARKRGLRIAPWSRFFEMLSMAWVANTFILFIFAPYTLSEEPNLPAALLYFLFQLAAVYLIYRGYLGNLKRKKSKS